MNEDMLKPCQCCGGKMRMTSSGEYDYGACSIVQLTCKKCNKSIGLYVNGANGVQQAFMAWNNMCNFSKFCNVKD